jgi:uroporphyrinogen decarboxylase
MTSRDRVEAALRLDVADRPPAAAWGHAYREEWDAERLAEVTVERARRLGWDFVKLQPRATCFAEAFGAVWRPSGHRLKGPVLESWPVRSSEDWSRVREVDAAVPALADQVEALRRVADALGPEVPVIQTVFSPLTVAGYLVGKDASRMVRDLRSRPEVVGPALDVIALALIDFARRSMAAGAAGVFYAISGYASAESMPLAVYRELVLPSDLAVVGRLPPEAWFNVLHLCGSRIHFDVVGELPMQVTSWSTTNRGNPSLVDGRDRSRRPVMGGLGQRTTLLRGSPEAIRGEAQAAIESTGGRGLLLAPGCSVPPMAREANLAAMMPLGAAV